MAFSLKKKKIKPKDLNRKKTDKGWGESGVNYLDTVIHHLSLPEASGFKGVTQYYLIRSEDLPLNVSLNILA